MAVTSHLLRPADPVSLSGRGVTEPVMGVFLSALTGRSLGGGRSFQAEIKLPGFGVSAPKSSASLDCKLDALRKVSIGFDLLQYQASNPHPFPVHHNPASDASSASDTGARELCGQRLIRTGQCEL